MSRFVTAWSWRQALIFLLIMGGACGPMVYMMFFGGQEP